MSLIEVKGLCKSFGNLEVLKDVSFTVDEAEVVVIIGGSGCGKSVTLRSIELLEKPDKGQIFINGREITAKGADIDSIRRPVDELIEAHKRAVRKLEYEITPTPIEEEKQ